LGDVGRQAKAINTPRDVVDVPRTGTPVHANEQLTAFYLGGFRRSRTMPKRGRASPEKRTPCSVGLLLMRVPHSHPGRQAIAHHR
jgi:hypothetical protein